MAELTAAEIAIRNKVKDVLYKKLSYTNQDYETILLDIIGLFKDQDRLNMPWDNVSSADIMFIFMSLLAAHKDILNYMMDYRVQEAFMSTAKEVASVKRIANSFGFKAPSYKAARAEFTLTISGTTTINPFDSFVDDNGYAWTYLGAQQKVSNEAVLELFQGIANNVSIPIANFSNKTKSHVISDQNIAIGNNYNVAGCSVLESTTPAVTYTEVDNLYIYNDTNQNVYSLAVDPFGLTYIKLHELIDLSQYASDANFLFSYLITSGTKVTAPADFTDIKVGSSDNSATLTPVGGSFYEGSDPLEKDELRESFKSYYASASALVTLEDYKNYVLNIQKAVPGITKCTVYDEQLEGSIASSVVAVYALKEDNTILTATEITNLADAISANNVINISAYVNDIDGADTSEIEALSTTVTLTTAYAGLTDTDKSEIKSLVYDLIMAKEIGESVTASEINSMLANYNYDYFYGGISFTNEVPAFNQYVNLSLTDITITVV